MKPVIVSDVEMAFGTVNGLPKWTEIPENFKSAGNEWCRLFSKIFFSGAKVLFKEKDGIDKNLAFRHIRALMASCEPRHEHKEAGVAYVMSQYFDSFEIKE